MKVDSLTSSSQSFSALPSTSTSAPSRAPYPYTNSTAPFPTITRGSCTGCALAALNPSTAVYQSDLFGNWTSLVVTETILTEFVTYLDGSTIDTVVTESKTVNQTKTVNDITDTRANFNVYLATPGLLLTLEVGPTYVIYTDLYGGADVQTKATAPNNATHSRLKPTRSTCQPRVSSLRNWAPTRTEDWDFFIQTFNGTAPMQTVTDTPLPVPTKLVDFLAQDLAVQAQFQGADINTCTLAGISEILIGDPSRTFNPPAPTSAPAEISVEPPATETKSQPAASSSRPPVFSSLPGTNTYLSTTYASTSKHVTRQGCLRCDTNPGDLPKTPKPTEQDPNTNKINNDPVPTQSPNPKPNDTPKPNDVPKPNDKPKSDDNPKTNAKPQDQPQNTPKPDMKTTPSVPDIINSINSDNPDLIRKPQEQPTDSGQTITIGNSEVVINPQPSKQSQVGPNQQTIAPTVVVIGTRTVTVGQTTTINGVPVIVPTAGGGSTIIVGDKTIGVNPRITQAPLPVVTVGHNTITANPQGQFVIGTKTLHPGGPELTVDGNTFTLGPNGKIAMWNSVDQTIVTMAGPAAIPTVTFGGQPITAKIIGGTTVFVLNDKTLAPGSAITVDGTTFSLPSGFHASSVVINGQTQRLSAGLPALTINNSPVTATVADGTTEFVLAPGETLTPGGVLTISGTTYSLPTSGAGSTIVINGATSRLNPSHLPVLPLSSEAVTATIAHGTTAFVFGPGVTLTPGGVVTVSGTTFSLPTTASGSVVVINGVTSTLAPGSGMESITSAPPILVDGETITATTRDGTTEYVVNSATTLRPDGQMIIDGTTYSLAPDGTALVINGKTSIISSTPASNSASTTSSASTSSTTSERGAGDFIASGIGESSKAMGSWTYGGGADKWVESLVMGVAGWLLWMI
ncbi:hypothetical protein EKO04_003592 [Ascochyta lentis]|uniref:Uncharacterized protein n=1 Tax=Ascochyta lentis TaxID=205686 RepID=A0A8H7J5H1_9PLEO|nr:hypothetical protein EKO04_003592 [Ascochyta lentis]